MSLVLFNCGLSKWGICELLLFELRNYTEIIINIYQKFAYPWWVKIGKWKGHLKSTCTILSPLPSHTLSSPHLPSLFPFPPIITLHSLSLSIHVTIFSPASPYFHSSSHLPPSPALPHTFYPLISPSIAPTHPLHLHFPSSLPSPSTFFPSLALLSFSSSTSYTYFSFTASIFTFSPSSTFLATFFHTTLFVRQPQ